MHEIAKGNAVLRITFLRWWRSGWGDPGPNTYGDGQLQVNFTDDETGTTIKQDINIPDTPAGEALVYSMAAVNGLRVRQSIRDKDSRWHEEWEVGEETPRLHKWHGYQ